MSNYIEEDTIREYIEEYDGIETAVGILEERQSTIATILRNEHNFILGKDRLSNVGG